MIERNVNKVDVVGERNCSLFMERYGYIPKKNEYNESFNLAKAGNGKSILYIKKEDGTCRRMNSLYDPEYEAERWAQGIDIGSESTCILVCGFLNGYFIRALSHRTRPDSNIIVYEEDEDLLYYVLQNFDIQDILQNDKIYVCTGHSTNFDQIMAKAAENVRGGAGDVTVVYSPGSIETPGFDKVIGDFSFLLSSMTNNRKDRGKYNLENYLYAINSLNKNYQIKDFYDRYDKDIPVIIVAGGPSLLKNIDELKEAKGRAIIAATDRAVTTILNHGILPDCIVTIDGKKDNSFINDERVRNIPVFADYTANRTSQEDHQGKLIYMYPEINMENVPGLRGKNVYIKAQGGSVATGAYILFAMAGAKRIILTGQDLAYTGGKTHADNRHDEKICEDNLVEVEGIDGGKLYASRQLNAYRLFFESQVSVYPATELIDATEGGALIHGSRVMTLNEAIEEFCRKDYDLGSLFNLESYPKGQTEKEHESTIAYMQGRIDELDRVIGYSYELKKIISRLLYIADNDDISKSENAVLSADLDRIRQKIYDMEINTWLEIYWIDNPKMIPDHVFYMRDNEEAKLTLGKAHKYYSTLSDECMSLKATVRKIYKI